MGFGDVGDEAGAGDVGGIEEAGLLVGGEGVAVVVVLGGEEVGAVVGVEEGGLVMVEPPGDAGGVFEIDDGVLGGGVGSGGEIGFVEEGSGAVDEAVVSVLDGGRAGEIGGDITCGAADAFGRVI